MWIFSIETDLGQAIEREDFEVMEKLYAQSELCHDAIDYVIERKGSGFIIKFAEIVKGEHGYLLGSLLAKKSQPVIDEVLKSAIFLKTA